MAEALIKGIVQSQPEGRQGARFEAQHEIVISEPNEERRRHLQGTYGVKTTVANREIVSSCDIIFLAVKPQNMETVLDEIAAGITDKKTVVSIAAGIPLSYLEAKLNTKRLIRVMPNTPALVQEGMSVMSLCGCFYEHEVAVVRGILMSVGRVITLPEELMDAVTALSGSGPAFVALFVEAMIESGEKMGINSADAVVLAVQTLLGTAKLLDTGMSPEKLRKMVTSPGGTTEAGLKVFDEKKLKKTVDEAMTAARARAAELGRRA